MTLNDDGSDLVDLSVLRVFGGILSLWIRLIKVRNKIDNFFELVFWSKTNFQTVLKTHPIIVIGSKWGQQVTLCALREQWLCRGNIDLPESGISVVRTRTELCYVKFSSFFNKYESLLTFTKNKLFSYFCKRLKKQKPVFSWNFHYSNTNIMLL